MLHVRIYNARFRLNYFEVIKKEIAAIVGMQESEVEIMEMQGLEVSAWTGRGRDIDVGAPFADVLYTMGKLGQDTKLQLAGYLRDNVKILAVGRRYEGSGLHKVFFMQVECFLVDV